MVLGDSSRLLQLCGSLIDLFADQTESYKQPPTPQGMLQDRDHSKDRKSMSEMDLEIDLTGCTCLSEQLNIAMDGWLL